MDISRIFSIIALIALVAGIVGAQQPAAARGVGQPATPYRIALPLIGSGPGAPPAGATSAQLIDAAVQRGAIDADTGLIYQLFADFGDPRLPAAYRGAPAPEGAPRGAPLWDAAARYDALTPEEQRVVAPFFMPPMHMGSWWQQRFAPGAAAEGAAPQPDARPVKDSTILDTQWRSVLAPNGKVRIWWEAQRPEDEPKAVMMAEEISSVIWPALRRLMGREPHSDQGSVRSGRGGDDAFDIVMVAAGSAVKSYNFCSSDSPGYMLFNRNIQQWRDELAHELMHAFQFAFKTKVDCITEDYRWLSESTAQWVVDYIYPSDTYEHRAAAIFLGTPELPLDTVNDQERQYGAYLAWLYLSVIKRQPELIGQLWLNAQDWGPVEVVERTIPGGFAALWPQVLLYNWNLDLVNRYQLHDGMPFAPKLASTQPIAISVEGSALAEQAIPADVERLAGNYHHYVFDGDSTRLVTFYNGLTFDLGRERVDFMGRSYDTMVWGQAKRTRWEGSSVQALLKINGRWSYEDWTEKPYRAYCRDRAAERLEELVLIVGNSRWESGADPVRELDEPMTITASDTPCWRLEGSATLRSQGDNDDMTVRAAGLAFEARPVTAYNLPTSTPSNPRRFLGPLRFTPVGGDLSLSGTVVNECGGDPPAIVTGTLSGSAPVKTLAQGNATTYLDIIAFSLGGPDHRHYEGLGASDDFGALSQNCDGGPAPFPIGTWMNTFRPAARPTSPGGTLTDSYEVGPGLTSSWNLRGLRQP